MFITTHSALGVLVAELVPHHPVAAFALGVASHFLSDIIPHGDSGLYKGYVSGSKVKRAIAYVMIDSIIAILFVMFLFNTTITEDQTTMTMGIVGGVLPDLIVAVYEVTRVRWLRWFHRVHFFFHNLISAKYGDLRFASGFAMQMIFLAALMTRLV